MLNTKEEIVAHIANTLENLYPEWTNSLGTDQAIQIHGELTALEHLYTDIVGVPYNKKG